jgi:hypothetical protein
MDYLEYKTSTVSPITFRPAEDVMAALDAERDRRPGVTLSYLLNEIIRAGILVPADHRPRVMDPRRVEREESKPKPTCIA